MPVPIPGPEVVSDSQKVKFLMIFGRPKTGFLEQFPGPRGTFPQFPLATNHAVYTWGIRQGDFPDSLRGLCVFMDAFCGLGDFFFV